MSNPAARLHAILTRAKNVPAADKMVDGWRRSLQLPQEMDDFTVMSKVGRVFTLPDLITKEIERFNDLEFDLYLGWRKDLGDAFRHVNFRTQFSQFSGKISTSLLMNIRFCAHELEKRIPEKQLSPEQVVELREAVWTLYNEVLKSELPPQLLRYALDHLFLIIEALDNYEITGAAGIELALNAVIGSVITQRDVAKKFSESDMGDKFWKTMSKIAITLELGKFGYELADAALKALGFSNR
jgi:hypothetical protein